MDTTSSAISGHHTPPSNNPAANGDPAVCYLKLLVSNVIAGSIIGQKGATISQIATSTGCAVRLSKASSFFPGTNERVVIIWGQMNEVRAAFTIILEKIRDGPLSDVGTARPPTAQPADFPSRAVVKIVVPNSAVSQLIGKEGQTIKELQDATSTKIQISNRNEHQLKERIVSITGAFDKVTTAAMHVMEAIQSDPHLRDLTADNAANVQLLGQSLSTGCLLPALYGGPQNVGGFQLASAGVSVSPTSHNMLPAIPPPGMHLDLGSQHRQQQQQQPQPMSGGGFVPMYQSMGQQHHITASRPNSLRFGEPAEQAAFTDHLSNQQPTSTLNMSGGGSSPGTPEFYVDVPDVYVGYLIGKQGMTLQAIQQQTGARIRVSGKGVFVPGTTNRRISVSGPLAGVQYAGYVLNQKLQEIEVWASQRSNPRSGQVQTPPSALSPGVGEILAAAAAAQKDQGNGRPPRSYDGSFI